MSEQRIIDFRVAADAPGAQVGPPLPLDVSGPQPRPPRSTTCWHVHHAGVTRIMNDAAIRSALSAGSLPPTALGWRVGMAGWLPLSETFAAPPPPPPNRPVPARADQSRLGQDSARQCASRTDGFGVTARPGATPTGYHVPGIAAPLRAVVPHTQSIASPLALLMVVVVLAIADVLLVAVFDITDLLQGRLGVGGAVIANAGALVAVALLSAAVTVAAWRHPLRRRAGAAAGLVLTLAAAATVFQGANAASFVIAGSDIHAVTLAMEGSPEAEITALGDGAVLISGELGPNLARDFMALDEAKGPFRVVEINSHGGFVLGALAVAATIAERELTVVVREQCLSACVLIAVASPRALAYDDVMFGFHRTTPLVDYASDLMRYSAEQVETDVRKHLSANGVPDDILEEAGKHGPETMHFVDAEEMFRRGIIEGVLPTGDVAGSGT